MRQGERWWKGGKVERWKGGRVIMRQGDHVIMRQEKEGSCVENPVRELPELPSITRCFS
jgi:hypothetical protein